MTTKLEVYIDENEIRRIVDELKSEIDSKKGTKIKNVDIVSIALANATKNPEWTYYLLAYKNNSHYTVTLKKFEKQPTFYTPLKISSTLTNIEDLSMLLQRIAKIYLIFQYLADKKDEFRKSFI